MANVILDETHPQVVSLSYSWWRIALLGAGLGIVYLILTFLVSHFIIDPIFCGSNVNALACTNSIGLAGNVASILVATIGLAVLVGLKVLRPLIVAVAAAIVLWGLAGWTNGLSWIEIAFWSALLYGLSYVLFSWISRYSRTIPVLISVALVVFIARIMLAL
ncbi:hypothetical protein H7X69_02240 [Candidatus Saccharibacteria bacterium]|nr:hypothetical protein [Candidatus Saccharibacteria bacterium]